MNVALLSLPCESFIKVLAPTLLNKMALLSAKYHHILNIARAIRFQASIPDPFWGKYVLHAAYLINRIPTPLLANRTPFEALFNKVPSFDHIKIFGCLCYAYNLKPIENFDVVRNHMSLLAIHFIIKDINC